jgi:hypothetical protein
MLGFSTSEHPGEDDCTMSEELKPTLTGAAAGAAAGFVVNLLAGRWRLWRLHQSLRFEPQSRTGTRGTARIYNSYIYPLNRVYAYISIEHDISDVLVPPAPFDAYVTPDHLCEGREDRLCWSTTAPSPTPPVVDIYAGERQALDIVNFHPDWIEIPSESGWATSQDAAQVRQLRDAGSNDSIRKSRVFLRVRRYNATIKIISKDTKAKEFAVKIDPDSQAAPVALRNR